MKKVKVSSTLNGAHFHTKKPVKVIAKNAIFFRLNAMGNMGGHTEYLTLLDPKFDKECGCFSGKTIEGAEVSVFTSNLLTATKVNLYAASAYTQENTYSPKKELKKLVVFSLPTSYEFDGFSVSDSDYVIPFSVGSMDKE
jgi:hypothetical protein